MSKLAQVLRKIGYFKPDAIFGKKKFYEMIIKTHPLNISKMREKLGDHMMDQNNSAQVMCKNPILKQILNIELLVHSR